MKSQKTGLNSLTLIYILLVVSPVVFMLIPLFQGGISFDLFSQRRMALLGRSLGLSLLVSVASIPFSFGAGFALSQFPALRSLKGFIFLLPLIPPYIHAVAWSGLLRGFSGELKSIIVLFTSFFPMAVCFSLIGFSAIPKNLIDSARVYQNEASILKKVIVPVVFPFTLAGACLVFLSMLLDYTVPSMFAVNTYAMEIFTDFSAFGSFERAASLLLPILLLGMAVLFGMSYSLSRYPLRFAEGEQAESNLKLSKPLAVIVILSIVLLLIQIVIPFFRLPLMMLKEEPFKTMQTSMGEFFNTLVIATATALFALFPCKAASVKMLKKNVPLWILCALPFVIPGAMAGISMILLSRSFPLLYGSWLVTVLTLSGRFAPYAVIAFVYTGAKRDTRLGDCARIFRSSFRDYFRKILFPLHKRDFFIGFLLVLVLSMGELGATLLVIPPGMNTITIKIFNMMHYGVYGKAATLSMVQLLIVMLLGGVCVLFMNKGRKGIH